MRVEADTPFTGLFVRVGREEDCCFGNVPAKRGWVVEVAPGEGCETALFGLCQYPRRIPFRAGSIATGFEGGWLLRGFCKTQYAGEQDWEHFLKCHLRVIHLLDFWRAQGGRAKVHDEGGYWKSRSETKLRRELEDYDRLIAALGGRFKDACDSAGNGWSVESPIYNYANFERLEQEGQEKFGGRI